MHDKLFTVVSVVPGSSSIRIALDSSIGIKPGDQYRQRMMPNGVIELIPERMGVPGDPKKADYKAAVIETCEQIKKKVELLNTRLDDLTALIKET